MKKENKEKHFVKAAYFSGGREAMVQFIRQNMKYPEEALVKRIEGVVSLRLSIDYHGDVTDVKVKTGIGYGCDEEAIRIAKLMKWVAPKTPYKLKVLFHKNLNIHFKLPKAMPEEKNIPTHTISGSQTIEYEISPSKKAETQTEKPRQGYNYTIQW
jgi:TonB family protein